MTHSIATYQSETIGLRNRSQDKSLCKITPFPLNKVTTFLQCSNSGSQRMAAGVGLPHVLVLLVPPHGF